MTRDVVAEPSLTFDDLIDNSFLELPSRETPTKRAHMRWPRAIARRLDKLSEPEGQPAIP